MGNLFNQLLIYPLLNLLVFAYQYIPDIGIVIILITILVRLILLPSFHKSMKHQRALQALQPKMAEIKEKHKDDQEKQALAMMELYNVHKVNPLSSCLPILIQLPLLLALYQVFIRSLNGQQLVGLYSFVPDPGHINSMFLGLIDLAAKGNYWMAAIAAILQFLQTWMMQKQSAAAKAPAGTDAATQVMQNYIMYLLPVMTFFFGIQFPAGLSLYWVATTVFGIAQQQYILKKETTEALYGKH